MKLLISLFVFASLNSSAKTPDVDKIFAEFDIDKTQTLRKKEHRKIFRKHRKYISDCLGIPAEQHRLEFVAYLYAVRWAELPRVENGLTFFTFYGTYFIKFHTTKKELQAFFDLCESY